MDNKRRTTQPGSRRLDVLDERVLAELDNDARQSNAQIARRLHVNKNVINYRIKNLEKIGIITGYYTVIDTYRLGYSAYRIYLKLQYASPEKEKEIMDYFVALSQTWWVGSIQGRFSIGALIWIKTQKEFVDIWQALQMKFRNFLEDVRVVIYHGLEHYRLPFAKRHLKERARVESIGVGQTIAVDSTDIALLRFIAARARASLLEVAQMLGVTPAAAHYRIRQLMKKRVILGYRAIVDTRKLGYTLYKMNINLRDMRAYEKMRRFAQEHGDIFYLDKTIGFADLEIEAYAQNPQQFYEIMNEIRTRFADVIWDCDFFAFSEITKLKYMPTV